MAAAAWRLCVTGCTQPLGTVQARGSVRVVDQPQAACRRDAWARQPVHTPLLGLRPWLPPRPRWSDPSVASSAASASGRCLCPQDVARAATRLPPTKHTPARTVRNEAMRLTGWLFAPPLAPHSSLVASQALLGGRLLLCGAPCTANKSCQQRQGSPLPPGIARAPAGRPADTRPGGASYDVCPARRPLAGRSTLKDTRFATLTPRSPAT